MKGLVWIDLTVEDAPSIRDFYQRVAGWTSSPVDMGGYEDFNMHVAGEAAPAAGVCHARGGNAALPPVWVPYFEVDDLDQALDACSSSGGQVVIGPKTMEGQCRYAVIRDPAGASAGLWQSIG